MAQQTINVGTAPNDGTGTPLRTAFQYTNSNFSELYTAVGPSGNNIVVPGSATITGDLTVDTSTLKVDSTNNRVGVLNTPTVPFEVTGLIASSSGSFQAGASNGIFAGLNNDGTNPGLDLRRWTGTANNHGAAYIATSSSGDALFYTDSVASNTRATSLRMTLNSTGLGVGASPSGPLTVKTSSGYLSQDIIGDSTNSWASVRFRNSANNATTVFFNYDNGAYKFGTVGSEPVAFYTTNSERMRIDSSGNVGIGVTPSAWASGNKFIDINSSAAFGAFGSSDAMMIGNAYWNGSSWIRKTANNAWRFVIESVSSTPTMTWQLAANGSAGSSITWTQAMTLDASGNLLVGQTASTNGGLLKGYTFNFNSGESQFFIGHQTGTASGTYYEGYSYNGTLIGSITQNGTTGVLYNITSDYRLKEQVQPLIGGLARVNALKPSVYKWKSDGSNGEGFLAHELAEVVPFAVSGEKDAVNEDGSIKSQGIDMSRVVPILVAAIQELAAEVNALKNA